MQQALHPLAMLQSILQLDYLCAQQHFAFLPPNLIPANPLSLSFVILTFLFSSSLPFVVSFIYLIKTF